MSGYNIDRKKWENLDILSQMGNIYSEVGRAFNANKRKDAVSCEYATTRAIDLFDATINILVKQKSPRAREVSQAKEQFLGALTPEQSKEITGLDRYFSNFAIAARLTR